jgi:hypothetical protein
MAGSHADADAGDMYYNFVEVRGNGFNNRPSQRNWPPYMEVPCFYVTTTFLSRSNFTRAHGVKQRAYLVI